MGGRFQSGSGSWTDHRDQFNVSKSDEIDLHFGKRDQSMSYGEATAGVREIVAASLEEARREGRPDLMFIHGSSTSRPGGPLLALKFVVSCARRMQQD